MRLYGLLGDVLVRLPNEEEVSVPLNDLRDANTTEESTRRSKKQKTSDAVPKVRHTCLTSDCVVVGVQNEEDGVDAQAQWLTTGIRVRIIDKRLDKGDCYLKKGVLVDIVRPGVANLLLDDSQRLKECIKASSLETVVPRQEGSIVIVVHGNLKGSKAKLLNRKSEKGVVTVQLLSDLSVHRFSFDDVAEYVHS